MHLRPHACDEVVAETTTICPWGRGLAASALLLPLFTNDVEQEFSDVRKYWQRVSNHKDTPFEGCDLP
jgi:hypothetical protein